MLAVADAMTSHTGLASPLLAVDDHGGRFPGCLKCEAAFGSRLTVRSSRRWLIRGGNRARVFRWVLRSRCYAATAAGRQKPKALEDEVAPCDSTLETKTVAGPKPRLSGHRFFAEVLPLWRYILFGSVYGASAEGPKLMVTTQTGRGSGAGNEIKNSVG